MLEKDLVYELFKDVDKVCESYIWCVFLEKLNSLNKDSQNRWVGIEGVRKMDGIENRKYRLVKKIFQMPFLLFCTRFRLVARSSELIL